jgi:hypothetical protein
MRFAAQEVIGDELDFSRLVIFAALGHIKDREEAPVDLVNRFLQLSFNPGSRVSG